MHPHLGDILGQFMANQPGAFVLDERGMVVVFVLHERPPREVARACVIQHLLGRGPLVLA